MRFACFSQQKIRFVWPWSWVEGGLAPREQHVGDHPHTPHVRGGARHPAVHHLGRHVFWCQNICLLLSKLILISRNIQSFTWCTDHVLDFNSVCTIQVSCETKINQFEAEIRVLTIIASVINTHKSLYIFNTLFENTILKGLMSRWMIFFEWR